MMSISTVIDLTIIERQNNDHHNTDDPIRCSSVNDESMINTHEDSNDKNTPHEGVTSSFTINPPSSLRFHHYILLIANQKNWLIRKHWRVVSKMDFESLFISISAKSFIIIVFWVETMISASVLKNQNSVGAAQL